MKHFIVSRPFTDEELLSKTLVKDLAETFSVMKTMIDFLNLAVA